MVDEEDYYMLRDLAREQEQSTGKVNISELSRETGFDRKTIRHHLSSNKPPDTPKTRAWARLKLLGTWLNKSGRAG